ncbi:MAG TPA: hypothetical protein VHJ59_06515 [Nitrososphaera sp.]|nr:hypothetical protein [Nitrososphaera sp.]
MNERPQGGCDDSYIHTRQKKVPRDRIVDVVEYTKPPEPTLSPVPPEDQSTDHQPVDMAQLCNSLTIQTLTDLDCTQYAPGGVQNSAEPTDQISDVSPPL